MKTRFLNSFVIALILIQAVIPVGALAYSGTDQPDYAPGATVTIQGDNDDGAGFVAGEAVHVDIIGPNGFTSSCDATADENTFWSCQVTLPVDAVDGTYSYVAIGQTPGISQSGEFSVTAPITPTPEPTVQPIPTTTPEVSVSSIIVRLVAGLSPEQQQQIIERNGGVETSAVPVLRLHFVEVPSDSVNDILANYRADSQVVSAEVDKPREVGGTPADPAYAEQWALPQIGWDSVYGTVTPAGTATLAILDTGIDANHPDLNGLVLPGYSAFGTDPLTDPNGHGTSMAGIAAAATNNEIGIAGVAYSGVKLLPVQVLGADGTGLDSDIITGIVWAVDNDADVILMAFSNPGYSPALQLAIDYAWDNDVVLVAATGNENVSSITYPAGDRAVIGVSATDSGDALAAGSNYGTDTFLAAPGVNIITTNTSGDYTAITGTSASAAIVAGAAALMKAVDPSVDNGVIVGRLARTADSAGTQEETGNGRLNVARALEDTSIEPVKPAGTSPVGSGGPYVGPYVAASWWFRINDVAVTEGNGNQVYARFAVDLNGGSYYGPPRVNYSTINSSAVGGSSCASGVDYINANGQLTFYSYQTQYIDVQVCGDTWYESGETFVVNISPASYDTGIQKQQGIGTIINDDYPPYMSISDMSVTEGNSGVSSGSLNVGLSSPSGNTVGVQYSLYSASANIGFSIWGQSCPAFDVILNAPGGSLTFNPGETTKSIPFQVCGDTTPEPNEWFTINIYNSAYASISDSLGQATIVNDDISNSPPVALNMGAEIWEDTANIFALGGYDTDGDMLGFTIISGPEHGSISSLGTPSCSISGGVNQCMSEFTYTPNLNYNGADLITYKVNDGKLDSNNATYSITIKAANDPPAAVDDYYSTDEDKTLDVTAPGVLGNDTDPDGNTLTAVLVGDPGHGTLTLNSDGSFVYTPVANYSGPDGFSYRASDGTTTSKTGVSITVNALNDSPVLAPIGAKSITYGDTLTFTATASDPETPSESLTFSLVNAPDGAGIDGSSGFFSWTPSSGIGTYPITVKVCDDATAALCDDEVVSVEVGKKPATVTALDNGKIYGSVDPNLSTTNNGFLSGDLALITFSAARTPGEDVNTYAITPSASGAALANYDVTYKNGIFTISQAEVVCTVTPYAVTYDGKAHTATGSCLGVNGETLEGLDLSGSSHTNADDYAADAWTFTDLTGNYKPKSGTIHDVISKADATCTISGYTGIYDANTHGASGSCTGVDGEDLSNGLNYGSTFAGYPGGTAYWNFDGGANYEDESGSVEIVISKAVLSVNAVASSKLYGSADPSLDYSLSVFIGDDDAGNSEITGAASCIRTAGESVAGSPYTITCLPDTLAAPNYNFVSGATADFTIGQATSTTAVTCSDGPFIYDGTSQEPCSVSVTGPGGLNLTLDPEYADNVNVGKATASYTYPGDENHTGSTGFEYFTIDKAELSVNAVASGKTYGALDPSFSYNLSGFQNHEKATSAGVTGSASCTRTAGENVAGSPYTITCEPDTLTAPNYKFVTGATAEFNIGKKIAAVTPDAASKKYGSSDPDLTGTLAGFLPADGVTATYSRTTGETVLGSPYVISAILSPAGVLSNYDITYNTASFTITPKSATVIAADKGKTYGDANPELTATITDTIDGDVLNYALDTSASMYSYVGPYPITVTLGDNPNYNVEAIDGTLTIEPRAATITANDKSKIYGQANPELTATIEGTVNGDALNYSLTTTAESLSDVGSYPIEVTVGSNPNYSITPTNALLSIGQKTATVTADPKNKIYGDDNPALTATVVGEVDGGDTIEFSLDTMASTFTNAGPYPIIVTLGTNPNYAVTPTNGILSIAQKTATVTANDKSKTYGDDNPGLTATVVGEVAGGDPIGFTLDTPASTFSNIGPYPIVVTLGTNPNYSVTPANGILTIDAKVATVAAEAKSKTYGDENPTLTAKVAGQVDGGDAISYSLDTTALKFSNVGPYPIVVTLGENPNYSVTSTDGLLTISPKAATITAENKSKVYGDENPDLTAVVTGTVNDDILDYSLATDAEKLSDVGPYSITVTLGTNSNYSVTPTNGTLSIGQKAATVTANPKSKIYGDDNPELTATVVGEVEGGDVIVYSLSTPALKFSTVGEYPIEVAPGSNPNYSITPSHSILTINPADTTTAAANKSAIFGDSSITLTATVTANSPSAAIVSEGTVTFVVKQGSTTLATLTSATVSSGAASVSLALGPSFVMGTYDIFATYKPADGAPNFNGSSVVTPAKLTIGPKTSTLAITQPANTQYSDPITLTATVNPASLNGQMITGSVEFLIDGTSVGSAAINSSGVATLTNIPNFRAPASYSLSAKFTSTNQNFTDSSAGPVTLTVTKEDARAYYTGNSLFWGATSTSSSASVTLSATIKDITAVAGEPAFDSSAGDIRNAKVTFLSNGSPISGCTNLSVSLVNNSDVKIGTVVCNASFSIGSTGATQYTISIQVNNYYARNHSDDSVVITVAQPLTSFFITGGGYLMLTSSGGQYAGDTNSKTNYGFNVKYNKSGTNLQGNVNIIFRSGGKVYQIKSNSLQSLGVTCSPGSSATPTKPCTASFVSKANLTDITDQTAPISLGGNLTLQLQMTDKGEPGSSDSLALALYDGSKLLFSSNWNGTKTTEQILSGGNLVVH